jgi:hypothetical protein
MRRGLFGENNIVSLTCTYNLALNVIDRALSDSDELDAINQPQWENEVFGDHQGSRFPNNHYLALLIAGIKVFRWRTILRIR